MHIDNQHLKWPNYLQNRWEIHKALAAASRAHARAVADGDTSLGSSPFMSTGSKSSLHTKRVSTSNLDTWYVKENAIVYFITQKFLLIKITKYSNRMYTKIWIYLRFRRRKFPISCSMHPICLCFIWKTAKKLKR